MSFTDNLKAKIEQLINKDIPSHKQSPEIQQALYNLFREIEKANLSSMDRPVSSTATHGVTLGNKDKKRFGE